MKCEDLNWDQNSGSKVFHRLAMFMHALVCKKCRTAHRELIQGLRALECPVPQSLQDRVMADAVTAASYRARNSSSQARAMEAKPMRRVLVTGTVVIILLAAIGVLSGRRGSDVALADVLNAMASIKTAHFPAMEVNTRTGEQSVGEVWYEVPSKFRIRFKTGADLEDTSYDGKKLVVIREHDGIRTVILNGRTPYGSGFEWFDGKKMLSSGTDEVVESRDETLPDGRRAVVFKLSGESGKMSVLTVDAATYLIIQVEEYRDGRLVTSIGPVEYNMEIADSTFKPAIPKNALVRDEMNPAPVSPEQKARWAAIEKEKLPKDREDVDLICDLRSGDSCGSSYHTGIRFTSIDTSGMKIWYIKSRGTYLVLGKAAVEDKKTPDYKRVVEDEEIQPPYDQDRLPGTLALRIDKPGDYRKPLFADELKNRSYHAERIQNVGKGPLIIMDEPGWMTVYGEAVIYPQGLVCHNGRRLMFGEYYQPLGRPYDVSKLHFGDLPAAEVKKMKEEIARHNHGVEVIRRNNKRVEEYNLPADAQMIGGSGPGGKCQFGTGTPLSMFPDYDAGAIVYFIPSRESYVIFGKARIVYKRFFRKVEVTVENGEFKSPFPGKQMEALRKVEEKHREIEEQQKRYMR